MSERVVHQHNVSVFWRSVRDCLWYGGQVIVLWLTWRDQHHTLHLVLAIGAAIISIVTLLGALKWFREIRRDRAERHACPPRAEPMSNRGIPRVVPPVNSAVPRAPYPARPTPRVVSAT